MNCGRRLATVWQRFARIGRRRDRRTLQRFEQRRQPRRQRGFAADRACGQPVDEIAHGAHSSR
jgi:hypothetical protein